LAVVFLIFMKTPELNCPTSVDSTAVFSKYCAIAGAGIVAGIAPHRPASGAATFVVVVMRQITTSPENAALMWIINL
jgi:hypothetical protein